MQNMYSDKILDYAASIPAERRLDAPDATSFKRSRLCGSEMTVDLKMDGERVEDFGMVAKACALGQCAASIVAQGLVGATADELYAAKTEMTAMLKEGGPVPLGRFSDLKLLEPVKDYPQRHASTLLVFEALADCLDQIAAAEAPQTAACSV